jgi:guanine nucleotide-binding protein subunit alpha
MEINHPSQPYWVRNRTVFQQLFLLSWLHRSIKMLLQVLKDEMDSFPHIGPSTLSVSHSPSSVHFPETTLSGNHWRHCMHLSSLTPTEALLMRKLPPEWRKALECAISPDARSGHTSMESDATHANSELSTSDSGSQNDPTSVLAAYLDDILSLWEDPIVRDVLRKHNVRLEDSPGLWDCIRAVPYVYMTFSAF